jgi:type I restriction enzyme S subunit
MSSLVPEGWSRKKLGDSLIPRPKSKLPSGESNPLGYYDFYVCSHKVLKSFHNEYSSPSILFSTGGEASVHLATERYAFSTDVWATEFEGDICNEYVFRLLEENIRTINYSGFQGSGIKHLYKSFIEKIEFSIPPLPEQKKIASILTSVDEVIESTQKKIDKLQDLKKAIMNELLTKGIGHTEFKDSELGRIPKSWEVVPVEELCSEIIDCVNKTAPVSEQPTPFKMIRTTNVRNGRIDIENVRFVSEETFKVWTRRGALKEGDIVFTREAPVGEYGLVTKPDGLFLGQRTMLYRPDETKTNPTYLMHCFATNLTKKQLEDMTGGSTVGHMRVPDCSKIKFLKCQLEEQNAIVKVLSSVDNRIEQVAIKLSQTQSLKKSLMQDLLTGKVRVTVN